MCTLLNLYQRLNLIGKKEFTLFSDGLSELNDSSISPRYKSALKEMKPKAMFCLENEPFILFFDTSHIDAYDERHSIETIHKRAWNFDKAPIIVISTSSDIIFYNAFDFDNKTLRLSPLTKDFDEFENFSYENLYSGELFNKYPNSFKNHNSVDKSLLAHITSYRDMLVKKEGLNASVANKLLARVIFLRYLYDREIQINDKKSYDLSKAFSSKNELYKLFAYLKSEFNGDLFDVDSNEIELVTNKYINYLNDFFNNVEVSGQARLFPFDFAIIPIELVSSIYENFLNMHRAENKSYYTPTFLVDYIINKTVSPFLDARKDSKCKVLDPACGSGVFLIEALRKIIQKEEKVTNTQKISAKKLTELVENNIYGIDKDDDAINIAVFSLYITLLDYQEPRSILKLKFPNLKNKNFFNSDSFNDDEEFNKKIKAIKPNFILSNPPYGSIKKGLHIKWNKKNNVPVNDYQIAESFLARVKDFGDSSTQIAMLVTSTIFYNSNASEFRRYFLSNFDIKEIFELSAVRRQIFNDAVPAVSIVLYSNKTQEGISTLKHTSLKPNLFFKYFKTLLIEKNDEKVIEQKYLLKNDWLWKVLLYGNILDFYFIKRLKDSFPTIEEVDGIKCRQGLIVKNGKKDGNYDANHLLGLPFLNTRNKELEQFFICRSNEVFNIPKVHRVRDEDTFKAPFALVKRGLSNNLSCLSAFSDRNMVFSSSIFSIKSKANDVNQLKSIVALLNSRLGNYLVLNLSALAGVEREEIKEAELIKFPIVVDYQLSEIVDKLQKKAESKLLSKEDLFELDNLIEEKYNVSEIEKDLLDYAIQVSIPIWKFGSRPIQPKVINCVSKMQLTEYAEVFCDNFAKDYMYFNVDIYHFDKCSLINFKAREKEVRNPTIRFINDNDMEKVLKQITPLSINSITNEIFIKKDIKGFNKDSFFIIKTNEYKNWHKAIARLDVNEFMNAIWEAEIDN